MGESEGRVDKVEVECGEIVFFITIKEFRDWLKLVGWELRLLKKENYIMLLFKKKFRRVEVVMWIKFLFFIVGS